MAGFATTTSQNLPKMGLTALLAAVFLISLVPGKVVAAPVWEEPESTRDVVRKTLDGATLESGFTLETPLKKFRVGVTPGAVGQRDEVYVRLKSLLPSEVDLQEQTLLSNVYVYDIFHKETVPVNEPIWIALMQERASENGSVLKMWDSNVGGWVVVPSTNSGSEVRAALHLPFAILAVFERVEPEYTGSASWYDWYGSAMNVYDIGDEVEVTNRANGATIRTTIVSRGPYARGRIIDLPREAFADLASIGEGVIDVAVRRVDR